MLDEGGQCIDGYLIPMTTLNLHGEFYQAHLEVLTEMTSYSLSLRCQKKDIWTSGSRSQRRADTPVFRRSTRFVRNAMAHVLAFSSSFQAIGILSSMVTAVEDHPHETQLVRGGGPYNNTMCAATYGPDYPQKLRDLATKAPDSDEALEGLKNALLERFPKYEAILRTTQAVDLIHGGVKVNALPEKVSAVVNHRIAEHSTVREVQRHITDIILHVARMHNLSVDTFGETVTLGSGSGGHVALSDAWGTALEPSPVTPTGKDDPYQILAGTIKATIESAEGYNAKGIVVAPLLAIGNTGEPQFVFDITSQPDPSRHRHAVLLERH